MSRIASVKESGEEISQTDWKRFERAVKTEVEQRECDPPVQGTAQVESRPKPAANRRTVR